MKGKLLGNALHHLAAYIKKTDFKSPLHCNHIQTQKTPRKQIQTEIQQWSPKNS